MHRNIRFYVTLLRSSLQFPIYITFEVMTNMSISSSYICVYIKKTNKMYFGTILYKQEAERRAIQNVKRRKKLEEMREAMVEDGSPIKPPLKPPRVLDADEELSESTGFIFLQLCNN